MSRVRDKLVSWSRDELVELVERMVHRDHRMIDVLDSPPSGRGATVDLGSLERQLDSVFRPAMGGDWRAGLDLAPKVRELAAFGSRHLERGQVANAVLIFATVSAGIRARYEYIYDDESDVARAVDACIEGLGHCLGTADDAIRQIALDALVDSTAWGMSYGLGEEGQKLITTATSEAERLTLADRVDALSEGTGEWTRQRLGQLVLQLRGQTQSLDARIRECRQVGDATGLVRALLEAHRADEAARVLEAVDEDRLAVELAQHFEQTGYVGRAYRVLERRIDAPETVDRAPMLAWLHGVAVERGEHERERWAVELFLAEPTLEHWMLMRESVSFSRRMEIRRNLELRRLWRLVTKICIAERRHRWAVKRFRKIPDKTTEDWRMAAELAEALKDEKPKIAANLWLDVAIHLAQHGEVEEGVGYAIRARDVLAAAKHPVLAKRHLAVFTSRTGGDTRVEAALSDHDLQ